MTSPSVSGMKFLVVEDEPLNAALCYEQLMFAGASKVIVCSKVSDALRHLEATIFDAAVVDFLLREYDSVPVLQRLRELQVPLVLVSGCVPEAIPDHFATPLLKPYSYDDLIRAIIAARRLVTVHCSGTNASSSSKRLDSVIPVSLYASNDHLEEAAE